MTSHDTTDNHGSVSYGAVSMIGDSHIRLPIGLQDASFCIDHEGVFVGVICDGSSMARGDFTQNQLGAIIGSEVIARYVHKNLRHRKRRRRSDFLSALNIASTKTFSFFRQFLTSLETRKLEIDQREFVRKKLLFTVIGVIVIENSYCVFGCGDGFWGKNTETHEVEKRRSSMNFLQSVLTNEDSKGLMIYKLGKVRRNEIFWVASDGLGELFRKERGQASFDTFLHDERTCTWDAGEDKSILPFRVLLNSFNSRFSDDITIIAVKYR
jgi:hypothetical protein